MPTVKQKMLILRRLFKKRPYVKILVPVNCEWLSGDGADALIDFGNGDCDKIATVSVNGGEPRTIVLR